MEKYEQILSWLSSGTETGNRLIDLTWNISEVEGSYHLENEKVPFTIVMQFREGKLVIIKLDTGIETATLESADRLSVYRSLLIMNNRLGKVKFLLEGMHENVEARVDLALQTLTKSELDQALNVLLSSLYMMVKALNLEEEFNKKIVERMVMLVKDMQSNGKSRNEIMMFLRERIGFKEEDANRIMDELLLGDLRDNDRLYG